MVPTDPRHTRQQQDREDLLGEAIALVERIELLPSGWTEPIVAGFRENGCASLFFGNDPVYQFNTQHQLRRAFVDGLLYKAVSGRLASMRRVPTDQRVELVRHDLNDDETALFLATMQARLEMLHRELVSSNCQILGQVPVERDILKRLMTWLAICESKPQIASTPHAK